MGSARPPASLPSKGPDFDNTILINQSKPLQDP